MANTLRNASVPTPTPGTDASIANMVARSGKRKKKSVFGQIRDTLAGAVDNQIRKRILGRSEVTGKF